jgi:prepilin-type N-terminal cleavage/methylation domain-containing protein
MKLTQTQNLKAKSGMTLLELTVVILVLLSLISILFVGARAWKKGSDRAGCILNIRNVQQAVRGHANMHNQNANDGLLSSVIYGVTTESSNAATTVYLKTPVCPAGGTYTPESTVPATGVLYITCSKSTSDEHKPNDYGQW